MKRLPIFLWGNLRLLAKRWLCIYNDRLVLRIEDYRRRVCLLCCRLLLLLLNGLPYCRGGWKHVGLHDGVVSRCSGVSGRPSRLVIFIALIRREKDHLMGIIIRIKSKDVLCLVSQVNYFSWLLYTGIFKEFQSLRLLYEIGLILMVIVNNKRFILLLHMNAGLYWLFHDWPHIDPAGSLKNLKFVFQILDLLQHCLLLFLMMIFTMLDKVHYLIHSWPNPVQHFWVLLIYIHSGSLDRYQTVNYHPHAVFLVFETINYGVLDPLNSNLILSLR